MATGSAPGASAWEALVKVTGKTVAELKELGFTDNDAIKLEAKGYNNADLLKEATLEDLQGFGLQHAHARYVRSKAAAAAQPPAAQPGNFAPSDAQLAGRIAYCGQFGAHIKSRTPGGEEYKCAAVVIDSTHIATYQHCEHEAMVVGTDVEVFVNDPVGAQRRSVQCQVKLAQPGIDVVVLQLKDPSKPLEPPVIDAQVYPGQRYIVLGQSSQAHADETSVSHGQVAATELDALQHISGDTMTGVGDSGGAVFATETSKLFAMCVGTEPTTHKSKLVPMAVIRALLAAQEQQVV